MADGSDQGHEEALNLVNVHKNKSNPIEDDIAALEPTAHATARGEKSKSRSDPDLQRAKDLVELHYTVKLKYLHEGLDVELQKAREDVQRVFRSLSSQNPD